MPWSRIGPYPGAYYKQHLACFACRKMVRKPSLWEMTGVQRQRLVQGEFPCPECGGRLRNMGKAFRPPRQSAVGQWRKIEKEYRQGLRWASGRW